DACLAGRAEGREIGVLEVELLGGTLEELGVLGDRTGPATLDEGHAELVEQGGDRELVRDGQVHALLLRAVAQRRVVHVERGGAHDGSSFVGRARDDHGHRGGCRRGVVPTTWATLWSWRGWCPDQQKDPPGTGGLRAGLVPSALRDNEGELSHALIMPQLARKTEHPTARRSVGASGASVLRGPATPWTKPERTDMASISSSGRSVGIARPRLWRMSPCVCTLASSAPSRSPPSPSVSDSLPPLPLRPARARSRARA